MWNYWSKSWESQTLHSLHKEEIFQAFVFLNQDCCGLQKKNKNKNLEYYIEVNQAKNPLKNIWELHKDWLRKCSTGRWILENWI